MEQRRGQSVLSFIAMNRREGAAADRNKISQVAHSLIVSKYASTKRQICKYKKTNTQKYDKIQLQSAAEVNWRERGAVALQIAQSLVICSQ